MAELIQCAGAGGQFGQEINIGKVKFKTRWEERPAANIVEWQDNDQFLRYEGMTNQYGQPHGFGVRVTFGNGGVELAKYQGNFVHG